MIASLRSAARVGTFDEAVTHCENGPYHHRFMVMNYVRDRPSTWVGDTQASRNLWVPTAVIERVP